MTSYENISDRLTLFEGVPALNLPTELEEGNNRRELVSVPTGEHADMSKMTKFIIGCEDFITHDDDEDLVATFWSDELGINPEDIPEEPPLPAPADFEAYAAKRRA